MPTISLSLPDSTMAIVDDVATSIERQDGYRPNRSQVIRMAVAALKRTLVDDGRLEPVEHTAEVRT